MVKEKLINTELIRLIKNGEQSAFELLFKLHYQALSNFARLYVKRQDLADEIVQETFIKIWEIRANLDENKNLKAFLYKCVHNHCLTTLQKNKNLHYLNDEQPGTIEHRIQMISDDLTDPYFDYLASEALYSLIHETILQLPPQCREIFLMCRFKNFTYQEIADKLNISVNTVKTQISRAMSKLSESLTPLKKNL